MKLFLALGSGAFFFVGTTSARDFDPVSQRRFRQSRAADGIKTDIRRFLDVENDLNSMSMATIIGGDDTPSKSGKKHSKSGNGESYYHYYHSKSGKSEDYYHHSALEKFTNMGTGFCADRHGEQFDFVDFDFYPDITTPERCGEVALDAVQSGVPGVNGFEWVVFNEETPFCWIHFTDGYVPNPCPDVAFGCRYDYIGEGKVETVDANAPDSTCYRLNSFVQLPAIETTEVGIGSCVDDEGRPYASVSSDLAPGKKQSACEALCFGLGDSETHSPTPYVPGLVGFEYDGNVGSGSPDCSCLFDSGMVPKPCPDYLPEAECNRIFSGYGAIDGTDGNNSHLTCYSNDNYGKSEKSEKSKSAKSKSDKSKSAKSKSSKSLPFTKEGTGFCADKNHMEFEFLDFDYTEGVDSPEDCQQLALELDLPGMNGIEFFTAVKDQPWCWVTFTDGFVPNPCPEDAFNCKYNYVGVGSVEGLIDDAPDSTCYSFDHFVMPPGIEQAESRYGPQKELEVRRGNTLDAHTHAGSSPRFP